MANWVLCGSAINGVADGATGPFRAPHSSTTSITGTPDLYIVITSAYFAATNTTDVSDSHSNSYTAVASAITAAGDANCNIRAFYKFNPSTSGTEWWSISSGSGNDNVGVIGLAFSGSDGSTAPGQASNNSTTINPQAGSTGSAGQLLVTATAGYAFDDSSIDSSYAIILNNPYTSSNNIQIGAAWQNLSGGIGGASNPKWTLTASPTASIAINITFTPAAGGGASKRVVPPNVIVPPFHSSFRERLKKPSLEEIMYYNKRKAA